MRTKKIGVLLVLVIFIGGLAFASLALADALPRATDWGSNPPTADSLVVGVPGEDIGSIQSAGVIQLLYGYNGSRIFDTLNTSEYFGQISSTGAIETDDQFGKAVAVADFNRDGYYDIAVGAPGDDNGPFSAVGSVNIFYGSKTGFTTTNDDYFGFTDVDPVGSSDDTNFGAALTTGDLNGDGYPDLAVGVPGYDAVAGTSVYTDAGAAFIFWGYSGGLSKNSNTGYDGNDAYGAYGSALATADFNGDGHDELVIGAPNHSTTSIGFQSVHGGTIYILTPFNGNQAEWNQTSASNDGAEDGDQFGASLAVGDFNGDGYPDLAVGAPGEDKPLGGGFSSSDTGAVSVMYNDGSGLSATGSLFMWQSDVDAGWNPHDLSEASDKFGFALAGGDFDNDGFDDLAIGVPYEDLTVYSTDYSDIGMVQLTPGSTTGITPTYKSVDLAIFEPGDNQYRGISLASGDFNTDGTADIATGLPGYTASGNTSAGGVQFCYNISTDPSSVTCNTPTSQADLPVVAAEAYDHFGWALATLPAPLSHKIYLPLILR